MSPQAEWMLVNQIQPRIASAVKYAIPHVGSEDDQELTQDATLMAARMLESAENKGKKVTPGNIAYYTLQHLKSGRRSYGSSQSDPHHPMTQMTRHLKIEAMEMLVPMQEEFNEEFTLGDMLSVEAEDPAMAVARKLDWEEFIASLNTCSRAIVECLLEDRPLKELAREFKISTSSINYHKNRLAQKILEFMGTEVLKDCVRKPQWKENLHAIQEQQACHHRRLN